MTQFWLAEPFGGSDSTPPGDLSSDADKALLTVRDVNSSAITSNTVAGPTSGVQLGASLISWWYRVNAVTISGTITFNVWMSESNMSANVGAQVVVDRHDGTGTFISTVVDSEKGTELPVGTRAAQNWTASPTSTSFSAGDHIRVRVYGNDIGTMNSGHTFNLAAGGPTAGADGDSYVTFTETIEAFTEDARVPYSTPYPQLLGH